jgi:hypothetical protein
MKYEVIDNYLPDDVFRSIQLNMIHNNFAWYFYDRVTSVVDEDDLTYYFTHIFFDVTPNSSWYKNIQPLVDKIKPVQLIRVKANLYPNLGMYIENKPHIDYDFENKAAVFYINNNNGYTILADGTKIESVENRMLFFNGNELHTSTHCTDKKYRMNINFNYL